LPTSSAYDVSQTSPTQMKTAETSARGPAAQHFLQGGGSQTPQARPASRARARARGTGDVWPGGAATSVVQLVTRVAGSQAHRRVQPSEDRRWAPAR
jgi:hypothetical protein